MEKIKANIKVPSVLFKSLLISYIITGVILAILALIHFKTNAGDNIIKIGTLITYFISCFVSGFLSGKGIKENKYLWGLISGAVYFIILFIVSLMLGGQKDSNLTNYVTMILVCLGSGMLGGMVS